MKVVHGIGSGFRPHLGEGGYLRSNQKSVYWSSEFGFPMKGRMNAVFDSSNGALVSEEHRAGTFPVSFSTTNHSESSAGTDLFLRSLHDKAKTRSSSAFQLAGSYHNEGDC